MSQNLIIILLGGIIPAIFFGTSGFFQKFSQQAGISPMPYIVCIGLGVVCAGLLTYLYSPEIKMNLKSSAGSFAIGFLWAIGMTMVGVALTRYNASLSVLAPLYNMNTLVAVVLALVIFSEWRDVNVVKLLAGTFLIIGGATLVSNA